MINDEDVARLIAARAQHDFSIYDQVLAEVTSRIRASGSASKADIGALVFWKRIQANTRWARELHARTDGEVRAVTGQAFAELASTADPVPEAARRARMALRPLPGFQSGYSLASALLVAAAPDRLAVYDRRAHAGLSRLGVRFRYRDGYGNYMALIESLRAAVNARADREWSARDVDLALFDLGR